jgi:hypothetical protein
VGYVFTFLLPRKFFSWRTIIILSIVFVFLIEAAIEWISRPRSRLFVNAGETAEIKWKFPSGAILVTYKKKAISGDEVMIASKQGSAEPQMFNATESIIRVEKSGALSVLKAGLKDEGFYEIAVAYKSGIILEDEVEIKIQGNVNINRAACLCNHGVFHPQLRSETSGSTGNFQLLQIGGEKFEI